MVVWWICAYPIVGNASHAVFKMIEGDLGWCLTMRVLRCAILSQRDGKLTVPAARKEPAGSIRLFLLLSGARWHRFCWYGGVWDLILCKQVLKAVRHESPHVHPTALGRGGMLHRRTPESCQTPAAEAEHNVCGPGGHAQCDVPRHRPRCRSHSSDAGPDCTHPTERPPRIRRCPVLHPRDPLRGDCHQHGGAVPYP